MTPTRQPWWENKDEDPILREIVVLYHSGLASVGKVAADLPLTLEVASWIHQGQHRTPMQLINTLLDRVFDDETLIRGDMQRNAASQLLGHDKSTYGMPFLDRRARVADDFYHQAVETFRRHDRGGAEADLLREIGSAIRKLGERVSQSASNSDEPEALWIERADVRSRLLAHLELGRKFIALWGEPGTGKTALANRLAKDYANGGAIVTLRAHDDEILQYDLVAALAAQGYQPAAWSDAYCRLKFKSMLAESSVIAVALIDNVESEDILQQLVPDAPRVPTIVTMRLRPDSRNITAEELHDFTESEAHAFLSAHLPTASKTEASSLARVLGYRPLALEHAVLFILESPDVDLRSLTDFLIQEIEAGLGLIDPTSGAEARLVVLYTAMLREVEGSDSACALLDSFLATAGYAAMFDAGVLGNFLASDYGGSLKKLHVHSGLRFLSKRGLLRQDAAMHLGILDKTLKMHTLTYRLLRELRDALTMFLLEENYMSFIEDPSSSLLIKGSMTRSTVHIWLRRRETLAIQELLPDGCRHFLCVDEQTWVGVYDDPAGQRSGKSTYIVRYEITPNKVFKLDSRTQVKSGLTDEEARTLYTLILGYSQKVLPMLDRWRKGKTDDIYYDR